MKKIQAVRGMNDVLPSDSLKWLFFNEIANKWMSQYGYLYSITPIVEKNELFVRSVGDSTDIVQKEMYSFEDKLNKEKLCLRPEGTASSVRSAIQHNLTYNSPQRLYYIGPMFRHERPQKGRYRQFHQLGAEAFGFEEFDIDVEHILMVNRLWKILKLKDIKLKINTLGKEEERLKYRGELITFLRKRIKTKDESIKLKINKNPLRFLDSKDPKILEIINDCPKLIDYLSDESLKKFEYVTNFLKKNEVNFEFDNMLVRGLDYYNDVIYEWKTNNLGSQDTICAGGRYDRLFENLGGRYTPSCGFAIGVERLLLLIDKKNDIINSTQFVFLISLGNEVKNYATKIAEMLRDQEINVIMNVDNKSLKSQMKKADLSNAKFAVIIGNEELLEESISIKPLRLIEKQRKLKYVDGITFLKKQLII